MTTSRIAIAGAALLWLCFAYAAEEPSVATRRDQVKVRLVFSRLEGDEYIFLLENDSSKSISLLLDKSTALDTAAECWSSDPILRAGTLFPLRDPDAPGHALLNTNVPARTNLELRFSSEILPRSVRLPEKAKNAHCHIRIQLHRPNKILESDEFEP